MRFVKFNANALVSVTIVNATVFWLLVQTGLSFWAAMLLANVATACWTFLINHFFVFRAEQEQKSESLEESDMTVLPIAAQVPSIALFMPAFNEAANLDGVVGRAYEFFDGMGISERAVIVVDDGSTDTTPTALADIASRHPIEVVTHETNRGYGRALRSGFEAALATGHEWIAYCDSDGQFDPADLAMLMVAAHSHKVNVVLGVRVKRADNLARRAAGRGWHGVSRLVLKYDASDVDCGFKLLHRTAVAAVAAELQSDYAAISPELLARLCRAGHRMVEVPVPHYPRVNGKQSGLDPKVVLRSFGDLYAVRRELGMDRALRTDGAAHRALPTGGWPGGDVTTVEQSRTDPAEEQGEPVAPTTPSGGSPFLRRSRRSRPIGTSPARAWHWAMRIRSRTCRSRPAH